MEKSQKRLIVFMPSMEGGGVEKNIILISNYLSNYFNNIKLITFDDNFNKKFSKKIDIVNYKKKTTKKFSKYFKYLVCLLILSKEILSNGNSLVISFQANIYTIILSKFLRYKIIVRSNSSPTGWTNNMLKNYIFKKFFKIPKGIIVNSYDFKKEIDKKFNLKTKVIYNPLNKLEIKKKSQEKTNFKFFEKKNTLKLINVARFTDQKDHITLLKAFLKVNKIIDVKLLLIGYGVNKNKLINFIKTNNLTKNVKILPYQKNPYKFIKKCDVFILSSAYEGLPNVLLESMTLKKFIISTDCPTGPREILNNGKYGLLYKVGNHDDLFKKIMNYKKNKSKYKNYIDNGYKSLERFNFNNNCKKYLNLIRKYM